MRSISAVRPGLLRRNRDLAAMTNIDGKVLFRAQPAGNYTIEAAIDGFSGRAKPLSLPGGLYGNGVVDCHRKLKEQPAGTKRRPDQPLTAQA